MTNHSNILKSLVIYAICLPLAVLLGYLVTNLDFVSISFVGMIFAILITPILLRFHHVLLIIVWNSSAIAFFVPGQLNMWLLLSYINFVVCIGHRTLDQHFRFISVPEITRPLVALLIVILVTAEARGGIGLRAMGGDVFGGKRYILLIGCVLGYFALTCKRIPLKHAGLYIALFYLPGVVSFIQDFAAYSGPIFRYVYLMFPPTTTSEVEFGVTRFAGLSGGSSVIFCYMLSRYGIKGIFVSGKRWRLAVFIGFSVLGLLGGFRSLLMVFILAFSIQFYLEGLHRTKLLPIILFMFVTGATLCMPFLQKLPATIQRTFAFIPGVPIDPLVRNAAEVSSEWRVKMWKAVIPQIPQYLLVGKGLALSSQDYAFSTNEQFKKTAGEDWWGAATAGDYHNGPLSVLMTFGLGGVLAFFWFLWAGFRLLYSNYRHGDPSLKTINTFLLAYYSARVIMFFLVVGGLTGDLPAFCGLFGFSVSLNGGMARPAPKPKAATTVKPGGFTGVLRRPPQPAFGRSAQVVD